MSDIRKVNVNTEERDISGKVLSTFGTDENYPVSQKVINEIVEITDSPEWLRLYTDQDGKIIWGIRIDGSVDFFKGIPYHIQKRIESVNNDLNSLLTNLSNGKYSIVHNYLEESTNPEWYSTVVDADNKLLYGITHDGEICYFKNVFFRDANINTLKVSNLSAHNIDFSDDAIFNIETALRSSGFTSGTGDWSDNTSLEISEPRFAIVNITGIGDTLPTSKTVNKQGYFECWDLNGNYFKKKAIFNMQGNSSAAFEKKNVAVDLCNDDWEGEDTFKLKIGNWVAQDSFHFKAYYTDFFKGVCPITYKIANDIYKSRGIMKDRPWKKALINFDGISTSATWHSGEVLDDLSLQIDNGARCMPDGFPCAIYLNGKFYGVYSWQLKKHRDNYHMNKKIAEQVHLDGHISTLYFWNNTSVHSLHWNPMTNDGFEVRNPKSLYCMDGTKYNSDKNANQELIDETSEFYESENPDHIRSKKVKTYVFNLVQHFADVREAHNSGDDELAKTLWDKYFDIENMVDYIIIGMVTRDGDALAKNWQWITYDGEKWFVMPYDKDGSWGGHFQGLWNLSYYVSQFGNDLSIPTGFCWLFYKDKIKERWYELVEKGILNTEHFMAVVNDWISRIGENNYKLEYKRWPNSPCCRSPKLNPQWNIVGHEITSVYSSSTTYAKDSYIMNNATERKVYKSLKSNNVNNALTDTIWWEDVTYNPTKNYTSGDKCYYSLNCSFSIQYNCNESVIGVAPIYGSYDTFPQNGGYYDNVYRLYNQISVILQKSQENIIDKIN